MDITITVTNIDTAAPVTIAMSVTGIARNSATVSFTASKSGTGYWQVLPATSPAPTPAALKSGGTSVALTANVAASVPASGLATGTAHVAYFVAEDSIGNLQTAVSSVNFTTSANSAPTANDFTYGTAIGSTAKTGNWKTLSGALDADGDALTASVKTQGTKGTVTVSGDNFTYTPTAGQTGSDSFVLTVSDGNGGTRDVTVTVNGINFTPTITGVPASAQTNGKNTAYAFGISVAVGTATVTAVSDNPAVVSSIAITGTGTNRTVTINPVAGAVGLANITVTATSTVDGAPLTDSKSFPLNFVNNAPTANSFTHAAAIGTAGADINWKTGSAAADANGDALSASVGTSPANGTATVTGDTVRYVPNPGFNGTDTFTLSVSDGTATAPAITVTVTADTEAPTVTVVPWN